MTHKFYKILTAKICGLYTLELTFDDGLTKIINLKPVLFGEIYSPLRNLTMFNEVKVDPEVFTIVWPNGADFEPSILHDWEKYEDELIERANRWETTKA